MATWATVKGFDFCASATFVTHPANAVAVIASDVYPIVKSIGGENVTCGWVTTGPTAADRDASVSDKKLASIHFSQPTETRTFRVDLPDLGTLRFRLALGDAGAAQSGMYIEVLDNTTSVHTISNVSTLEDEFYDATGVKRTSVAAWSSDNAQQTEVFATTTFLLRLGGASASYTTVAHLELQHIGASAGAPPQVI